MPTSHRPGLVGVTLVEHFSELLQHQRDDQPCLLLILVALRKQLQHRVRKGCASENEQAACQTKAFPGGRTCTSLALSSAFFARAPVAFFAVSAVMATWRR